MIPSVGTFILTVALALGTVQAQTSAPPPQEKEKSPEELAIERVQKVVVRTLDGSLPERTLQAWLKEVFGPTAKTTWEFGDCGEGTGNLVMDRARTLPTCVDAAINLDARRVLHLVFAVAVQKPGTRPIPPTFNYGVVMEGGSSTRWIKALGEASRIR